MSFRRSDRKRKTRHSSRRASFVPSKDFFAVALSPERRRLLSIQPLENRTLLAVDTVTSNLDDGGAGTLRSVIATAASNDTIEFASGISQIDLTQGQIEISKKLTMEGPGASTLTIDQTSSQARLFLIDATDANNNPVAVSMSGLTLTGGNVNDFQHFNTSGGAIDNQGDASLSAMVLSGNSAFSDGGAIINTGVLTITGSTISDNSAEGGGAIANISGGMLMISDSTVSGNSGVVGAGIVNGGTLTVTRSTFSGNAGSDVAGAIENFASAEVADSTFVNNSSGVQGGGIDNSGGGGVVLTVTDSTFSGNSAPRGAGITNYSGTAYLADSIVVGNAADQDPDVYGVFAAADHNLIGVVGDATGFNSSNIVLNSDDVSLAHLGPLADNGGPTQTMALLPGSPAIDAGDNSPPSPFPQTPATGQRGLPRIIRGTVDIGAYELQPTNFPISAGGVYTLKLVPGTPASNFVELVDANGNLVDEWRLDTTPSLTITNASGQSVQLVLDSTNGGIPIPVTFDGGAGTGSSLVFQGGTSSSDTYSPGPGTGQGDHTLVIGGVTENVSFVNLTPVYDSVAGTLTVNGINGNDAINYTEGDDATATLNAAWGQVAVNNLEAINFTGKTSLTMNSLAGDDTFSLNNPHTPTGLTGITVNGGDPSAGDTANFSDAIGPVTDFEGDNTVSSKTVVSGYSVPVTLSGIATANLNVGGQTMTATGTSQNDKWIFTPTGATAGTFYDDVGTGNNLVPNTIFNIANVSGNFMVFNDPGGNADQVTLRATDARDLIEIAQGPGTAQVLANNVTGLLPVELGISAEILNVLGLGGENTFQVIPAPGIVGQAQDNMLINLDGGDTSANNTLILGSSFGSTPGTLGANQFVVVNKSPVADSGVVRVFTSAVANPDINYQNVQIVSANVAGTSPNPNLLVMGPDLNEPNDKLGSATFLGSASTIQIQHAAVFPGSGEQPGTPADNDYYRVLPQITGTLDFQVLYRTVSTSLLPGGGSLSLQVLDAAGNVLASGSTEITVPALAGQSYFFHVFGASSAAVNGYDATIVNTDTFNLSAAHENVTVRVDPNDSTHVQVLDGATVLQQYSNNASSHINFVGDDNSNTVTVDSSNGLVKATISFDGGGGKNDLILQQTGGGTQTTDVYSVGPNPGQGTDVITGPSGVQSVSFVNLAPVQDNVPAATATVSGTNGDNAITYAPGPGGGIFVGSTGLVTVDNQESYEFNDKANLVINTLAGTDTVNLNNANKPAGLNGITVNGGNSSAGDALTVNGTTASDSINFAPTSPTSAAIMGAGPVKITANGIGQTAINGQGGDDALAVVSPDVSEIGFTPGATIDSGSVTMQSLLIAGSYMPLSFRNLGTFASLAFADTSGMRADGLDVYGTSANNQFNLSTGGVVQIVNPANFVPLTMPIATPGIAGLHLIGHGGNDTFNVPGNHLFGSGVDVQGYPAGSNAVNFTGNGAPVAVDLGAGTVDEKGFAPVSLSSINTLSLDGGGASVTVGGTALNDSFSYAPQTATEGLVQLASSGTLVDVSNVGGTGLTLDALGGSNTVTVNGTSNNDTITTALGATTTVSVDSLLPINLVSADMQSLVLSGIAGSDIYAFNGTGGIASVAVVGGTGDNRINLPGAAGNDNFAVSTGSDNSSGTASYSLPGGASPSIAFSGVSMIGITGDGGAGSDSLSVSGTGGHDTFNLQGTGTSAGTAQVNGGPMISFAALGTGAATTIDLNGNGGADTFNVTQPANWKVPNVLISGGTPGAGGNLLLNAEGTAGSDAFTYTSTGPQSGTVGLTSVNSTSYALTNIASLALNELGAAAASLTVTNANVVITPSTTPNSGTVTTTDTNNSKTLLPLTYTNIATVTASGTSAVIDAPDDGDNVTISASGLVTVTNKLGAQNTINASGYTKLAIDLLGANDTLTVLGDSAAFSGGVTVVGGENGYTVTAPVGAASALNLATNSVSGIFGDNLTLVGIGNLVLNGTATAMTVSNYGAASTLASVTLNGDATIAVSTTGTGNTVDFTSLNPTSALLALATGGPTVHVTAFSNTPGNLTVTSPAGVNSFAVLGSGGNDLFTVSSIGAIMRVRQTDGGIWVPVDVTGFRSLEVSGGAGTDTLTVDSSAGAVTTPIVYDGVTGSDSLVLSGGTASDTYIPGPQPGQGSELLNFGTVANPVLESVTFSNLTPVYDSVAGSVTVLGTSGNDALSYTEGNDTTGALNAMWGQVSVNNQEALNFTNKTSLTINTGLGTDTVSLNNPHKPTSLTGITVNGGDNAAGDQLIVSGTTGTDSINFAPTSATAATISGAGPVTITTTGIGRTTINGQGGDDALAVISPDVSEIAITTGASPDAGSVSMRSLLVAGTYMPLSFTNLGTFASLAIADASGTRVDGLEVYGTNANNQFNLSTGGVVQVVNPANLVPLTLPIATPGVAGLHLIGQGGDDTFNVPGHHPFTSGIDLQGNPAGNNVVNFAGNGAAAVTVDLSLGIIAETGFGPVSLSSIGTLNADATGAAVTVTDSNSNLTQTVTPSGPTSVTLQTPGLVPIVNVTTSGIFATQLTGLGDTLIVDGTTGPDTFSASDAAVDITGLLPVNISGEAALDLSGGTGNDTFNVTPSATVPISVDGGDPVGVLPGDTLNIAAGGGAVKFFAGPTSDSGGFLVGTDQPVSFIHIESIGPITGTGPGSGPVLIQGTNGDDDIQVTATGPQSFTVSVNQGPAVQYVNEPTLYIDTLAGDDEVNVTGPVAGSQYNWDESIFLAGVSHAAGSNNIDSLTVETPRNGGLNYAPTGAETGALTYDQGGGNASKITFGAFTLANFPAAGNSYSSSIGGVEQLVVNGEAAGDPLSVSTVGPSSVDYSPGATSDAATIAVGSLLPLSFTNLGSSASVSLADAGGSLVYNGTAANDSFTVSANGVVTLNNQLPLNTSGLTTLTLNGLAGDNTYTLIATTPFTTINVNGSGASDPDVLNLFGDGVSPVILNLGGPTASLIGGGLGTVDISGVGVVNLSDLGAAITVSGTTNPDTFNVTPTGLNTAIVQVNGVVPQVNLTATNLTIGDTNPPDGDKVIVNGTNGGDLIDVARGAITTVTLNGALPVQVVTADTTQLTVATGVGADHVRVSGSLGPDLTIIGGQTPASDELLVINTVGGTTYTPGNTNDSGTLSGGDGIIYFSGMAIVDNIGIGSDLLTVRGTNGDDTITAAPAGAANTVSVNAHTLLEFNSFATLDLNGFHGNDSFIVSPVGLTGVTAVNITAATGANNSVTVNGSSAADAINYTPTIPAGSGTVAITGSATVSLTDMASLNINGQGGGDSLTITTPAASTITYGPGATVDSGTAQVNSDVPLSFSNLGTAGTVSVAGNALSTLVYNGTSGNDTFGVPATGVVTLNNQLPVSTTGVTTLTLNGLDGDNTYNITGAATLPYTTINVHGSGLTDPDVANLTGDGTAIAASVGGPNSTVTGGGLGTVNLMGVGTVNINAATAALTANGTAGNDTFSAAPTGANGVMFQAYSGGTAQNGQGGTLASLATLGPAFNATNVSGAASGFTINGNGGSDMLFVEGTENADTIDVNDAVSGANAVLVAGLLALNYSAALAHVEIDGLAGSDTINIAPSTTTSFLVDGGDPIGVVPGDTLNLVHPPGPFQIFAGPTSDSGGLNTAGFQTVSWAHIESIVNTGGGSPIITGTNGNDEITVIARDSSYNPANPGVPNPLLDGVQDFTVSVNGGPDMLFVNTPNLFIDALSGNDDIVVREPAPNNAAWNVQIYVAGGTPASGANRLGDNIELETPGTQSVTYTPNNPLASVPAVPGVTFSSPNAGGGQFNDTGDRSTITATQFLISGVFQSSPGGAENFIYAGEAGNDTLTYNTPANGGAGSNLIYTPGATPDAGTINGSESGGAALTPLTFSSLGTTGTVSFTTSNTGRTDHLNVEGLPTAAGESFSVTPASGGTVQLSQLPPSNGFITVPITTASVSTLEIDGLGGNDQVNLTGALPYTNTIVDDGAIANLSGATGAVTVNLANSAAATNTTITGYGGTVTLTGVDVANVNAGTNGVSVNGSTADDSLAVTPTGPNSATAQDNGAGTVFNVSNAASFTTDLMGGNNSLTVNGSSVNDAITAQTNLAANPTVTVTSGANPSDLRIAYVAADLAALDINGLAGNDVLTVDATNGAVTPAINYDGGTGTNAVQLKAGGAAGNLAISDVYTPGSQLGSGTDALNFTTGGAETVHFVNLAPIFDFVAGPLTVNGTNAANSIDYKEGYNSLANFLANTPSATWGQVSVDSYEPIEFINKTTLAIDGLAGGDTIDLNNPNKPTGLTAITVDAGNPTSGTTNTLIVNGAAGTGPIVYSPTAADGGNFTGAGSVPVALTHIQNLDLNDQGLGDVVTVNGTAAGNDTFVHTPGSANDAGNVAVNNLLPLNYQNMGTAGSININETGAGTNTLVVQGTDNNDAFGVAGATGTVTLNSRVPITQTGIQNLQLNGLAGSDTFTLNATMPYTNVALNGGNTANNDAVILSGATGAIAVNLANQSATPPTLTTITGYGGTVSLSDIAQASLNGSGADTLTLTGTPNDDQINYQPTSASGGNFSLTGLNTNFTFNIGSTPANTFTIFGGGNTGGDQVNVRGPNAGSTFIVVEQTGVVTVSNAAGTNLMSVILGTNVQTVELDAGVGNNTFLVDPAPGLLLPGKTDVVGQPNFVVPNNLLVNVVGGGAASQNALIVAGYNSTTGQSSTLDPSLFAVVNRTSNTAGVVRVFHSNGPAPANEPNQFPDISYAGIGTVSANTATNAATHQQQTLTLGPDLFDPNGSLNDAAYLGSGATINATNLAIFPNAFEHRFLEAEQDWFRVVAQSTGTMDFQIYFNQYAGFLPGNGELQIQVYDSAGNQIADFGVNDQTSDQRRRIPVVAGETYYLQVYGVSQNPAMFPQNAAAPDVFDPNNATVNAYSITIVNTPAPTPDALGLNNVVAQGTVNNSAPLNPTGFAASNAPVPAPVIPPNFQTQPLPPLSSTEDFYVGMYLEFTSGALIGQRQLVSSYIASGHIFIFSSPFSAAPAPGDTFQIESSDTGRSQLDNVTRDNRPTIYIRLDAANAPNDGLSDLQGGGDTSQTPPNNVPIPIPFWAGQAANAPNLPANFGSFRVVVYDETNPLSPISLGYADPVPGETGVFQLAVTTLLSDGAHKLVAKVEMDSAGTPWNHDVGAGVSLSIVVDTQPPPVYFGSPTVPNSGLYGSSDTGVAGQPTTIADRITADSTPTFYGVAEADAIVRLYVDMNRDGKVDNGDVFIGQTVATPIDGTNQNPSGQWTLTSSLDLNNPKFAFPHDGVRTILATAEDVAGNVSAAQSRTIFLDTQGPQVGNVSVTGNPGVNLFLNKPNQPTPTPLVNALDVTFTDQPIRVGPDFVYPAVNPILATTVANYQLVGKNNGPIPITSVTFVDSTTSGTPGMSVATLHFASPLPDDTYTLTISDRIEDNAGNPLDGEFNGTTFPSGNMNPGGTFGGTFVVNSHPHVAVYSNGSVSLDINGNGVFDPSNTVLNSDLVETFGYPSDRLFDGNFASPTGFVSGFDELGAYGFVNNQWRWLLNLTPAQGTTNPATFVEPFAIDGLPVAGTFAGNKALGDQVGLFDGTYWWLDVLNHHTIDEADVAAGGKLASDMKGIPIVGDFDGDGKVDLATYQDGVFEFDLSSKDPGGKLTGNYNATINVQSLIPNNIGFSGVLARPVAADIDQDGITDLGLYVPGQTENAPYGVAEWFWLVSKDSKDAGGVNPTGAFASLNHPFSPTPLGNDLFYRFGNQFALPLVGIWDPPTSSVSPTSNPPSSGWVDGLYQNVLGRQPSAEEVTNWSNAIASGQTTASQVAQNFIESSERLGSIISGYYQQYLGRTPDQSGLNYWIGVWQQNGGPEQVQAGIIGSSEYYATAGKLHADLSPDAAWVTALYNNILGRAADSQGLAYWVNFIQTNSKQSVVLGFVTSSEYRLSLINGWFEQYLGRPVDAAGGQYWVQQMQQGVTQDAIQTGILTSEEFRNKQ